MYSEEIESVIVEYLNNINAEYAVMIDGEWGSGKTYFLKDSLMRIMENIDNGKNKRRKYAYVSLYGVKSIEEISKEIVFQFLGKKNKKKVENGDAVLETVSNVLTASFGVVNIDLSKIKNILNKIEINDWLICFDDLERCSLPVNEILGYINRLVEHNKCKVIVLANEQEIGTVTLHHRLEEKYQVVLSGRRLLQNNVENSKTSNPEENMSISELKQETRNLFDEDILYKTVREKVIGLTIKYEPQMDKAYDSIISKCGYSEKFKEYLVENKRKILGIFENEECRNLRTLISAIGSIQKVYYEMLAYNYDTEKECFEKIVESFQKYIVLLSIYYKNGGNIRDLNLTAEIGYVSFKKKKYDPNRTRGYKFLEKYCTTLSFSKEEFISVVAALRQEYKEEKSKPVRAEAYGELSNWWEKEDEEVEKLIFMLKAEVKEDKYPFHSYQGIIGQLLELEHWKYDIGDMDVLIDIMNENISKSDEPVNIERFSYSFKNNAELREKYEQYVDQLKLKAGEINRRVKASEISEFMGSEDWAEKLLAYCDNHYQEFTTRYGFIDLLDTELLLNNLQNSSTKQLCITKDIFKKVYGFSNIRDFYFNDLNIIKKLREEINRLVFEGINKPLAKNALVEYLDDIIKRLGK